ncbi:hypothetical protein FQN51_009370 [Onygenales sp. PD_10]|nr:hypothetical protein FQN51_009370 [Onygenales sp. PD_10]
MDVLLDLIHLFIIFPFILLTAIPFTIIAFISTSISVTVVFFCYGLHFLNYIRLIALHEYNYHQQTASLPPPSSPPPPPSSSPSSPSSSSASKAEALARAYMAVTPWITYSHQPTAKPLQNTPLEDLIRHPPTSNRTRSLSEGPPGMSAARRDMRVQPPVQANEGRPRGRGRRVRFDMGLNRSFPAPTTTSTTA